MIVKGGLSYYKKIGAATKTNSFLRTKKFGGGSLMIFGFITVKGDFKIYKCPKRMNSETMLIYWKEKF